MKNDDTISPVITLCALTYHRPVGVAQMLTGLGQLTFTGPMPNLQIVIVDNDPDASARQAVTDAAKSIPWPVRYCVEPRHGITYARNRALTEVGKIGCSDWIGFIDDDEIPRPDWLDELLRVQREYDADVVAGPVIPEFLPNVPSWITEGGFFNQMRYDTGTRLPYCFTNNVIFRTRILRALDLCFDHRFALTGGEDRHFFQRIGQAGYRIVWADDACVSETVPESRACAKWFLQRSYRCGSTVSIVDLANEDCLRTRLCLLARACYCLVMGAFLFPLTWPFGLKYSFRDLHALSYGAGMFAGLFGSSYAEYKKIHGH